MKATLRITPQEKRMLTDEFGSDGRGLRALVDRWWSSGRFVLGIDPGVTDDTVAIGQVRDDGLHILAVGTVPHPMLDDDLPGPPGLSDVEQDFAAALALDKVKQALPIGDLVDDVGGTVAVHPHSREPLDLAPLPGTIAAGIDPLIAAGGSVTDLEKPTHRHKRGPVITTYWDAGTKKHTYACQVEGCPVVLS